MKTGARAIVGIKAASNAEDDAEHPEAPRL